MISKEELDQIGREFAYSDVYRDSGGERVLYVRRDDAKKVLDEALALRARVLELEADVVRATGGPRFVAVFSLADAYKHTTPPHRRFSLLRAIRSLIMHVERAPIPTSGSAYRPLRLSFELPDDVSVELREDPS